VGAAVQRAGGSAGVSSPGSDVAASGQTTTVDVVARGMRYEPNHITVPYGDRLIINVRNEDNRRHDLVLANGARTDTIPKGGAASLDAGVVGADLQGWCSLPGHRQAGMVLTVTVTGGPSGMDDDTDVRAEDHHTTGHGEHGRDLDVMAQPAPDFVARDASLPPASTERLHRVTLRVQEVE